MEKKYINAVFITAFVILVAVNVITYFNVKFHLDDEGTINNTFTAIQISESLLSWLSRAESSKAGYLMYNDIDSLNKHNYAVSQIDSLYKNLKTDVKKNNRQRAIVDSLGFLIAEIKNLWQGRNVQNNTNIGLTSRDKELLERAKALATRFQDEEKRILKQRLKESETSASYTLINQVVGSLIAYILLITGIVILNKNISRTNQVENSLWESRNWFETTLQNIGDGVIVTGKVGDIVFMNKVAENITGWKESEAKGLLLDHIFNVVDEKTGVKPKELANIVFDVPVTGKIISGVILKSKNSSHIPIEFSASSLIQTRGKSLGNVYTFRDITERRNAEKELLDGKKFIQRITDSIPSIIYSYSLNGPELKYINYKIVDLLGYTPAEALSNKIDFFSKLIHPDDLVKLSTQYQKFLKANDADTIDYEYRIKNSKGEWRFFRSYDVVFARAADRTIREMLGTAMDITEEKKLEQEIKKYSGQLEQLVDKRTKELSETNRILKKEIEERAKAEQSIIEAEEKFRNLVENSLVGIYIIQDDKFVYTNPKLEELFGFGKDELSESYIYERVHPEYIPNMGESIKKSLNNEIDSFQTIFKGIKKDGLEIDVEVRGTKMNYKGSLSIIGSMMDITEHKQHEEAILEQQQFLKTVIDTSPGFIFAKDWHGKFTLANKSVADLYDTTVENLIGKRDADFNINIDEVEHFINDDREVISKRKPKLISEEIVTNSATKESRWYQTIKIPLITKKGDIQVLGISTDITERKLAEEITKKSLQEKELLLKEIHHRVKNNLQIIVSLLKLQSKYLFDTKDLQMFNDSRSRVETMAMIHEKLYKTADLGNIDLGNYLTDLMNNILKSQRSGKKGVELDAKYDKVLIGIDTAIPCGLIVNELLLNIIKYSINHDENKKISFLQKKYDDKIHIQVSDNGKGISSVQKLDSPDSLGFQLIQMLVKQLEGEMTLINDEGTRFCLSFKELIYKERI